MSERLPEHVSTVEHELIECQRKLAQSREREQRYQRMFESMPEGYGLAEVILDERGQPSDIRLLEVNQAFYDLTHFSSDAVSTKTVRELVPAIERRWIDVCGKVFSSGKPARFEYHATTIPKWFEIFVYRPDPEQLAFLLMDITERKHAEDAAIEQIKLAEAVFTHSISPLVVLDRNYNFLRVNEAYAHACQRKVSDFAGRNHFEMYPSDVQSIFDEVIRTRKPFAIFNRPFVFPDQPERGITYWDWTLVPVLDQQQEVEYLVFSLIDVTERMKSESEKERLTHELQDSVKQLMRRARLMKRAEELAGFGYWESDLLTKQTTWSEGLYHLLRLDYDPNPRPTEDLYGFVLPEDRPGIFKTVESGIASKAPFRMAFRARSARGDEHYVEAIVEVEFDSEGRQTGTFGAALDATRRKAAEDALRKSEERYRRQAAELELIYRTTPVGLCVLDTELRYVHVNGRLAEMNGVPVEAHLGKTIMEVVPDIARRVEPMLRHVLETGEPVLDLETSAETLAQPGVQRTWISQVWPLMGGDGNIVGINIVAEEITERKRLEQTRRREKEFRTLAENSSDIIARFDRELRRVYVNPAIEAILGQPREKILGKTHRESGLPGMFAEVLNEVFATGRPQSTEATVPTPKGERSLESCVVPEFGPDGRVETVLAISRDITERKRAENALRESEKKYRTLVDSLNEGVWLIDETGTTRFVNARLTELLGYQMEEMLGKHLYNFMDQKARSIAEKNLARGQGGIKADYEFEFQRKDGTAILTRIATTPLFDNDGHYQGALAGVVDISEQKYAEAALKAYADGQDFLVGTALRFLRPLDWSELFNLIVERVYALSDGGIVLFNEFDSVNQRTIFRAMGSTVEQRAKLQEILGRDPIGLTLNFPESVREQMQPGEFTRLQKGMCELAFYQLPQALCEAMERELDIRAVYAMACSVEQDLLGTVAVLAQSNDNLRQKRLIESIVAQAALALKRKRVEDELSRRTREFEALVERSPDIIVRVDRDFRIRYINSAVERQTGRAREWFLGKTPAERELPQEEVTLREQYLREVFESGRELVVEHKNPSRTGDRYFQTRLVPEFGQDGKVESVLAVDRDIDDLKRAQQALEELTLLDPLTGVANRRYLERYAKQEWRREARHHECMAVIMADIDHFKAYNDHFGHLKGDECLREVASALQQSLHRPTDTLIRYGGEEFAVLLPETDLGAAREVAERLRQAVEARELPNPVSEPTDRVTISLGVASIKADEGEFGELMAAADLALYRAKECGRNRVETNR